MPQAIAELQELAAQIKKDAVNIIDVVKNIDEMNYTKKDEEQYKKRTITLANSLKSLYEKKDEANGQTAAADEFTRKQAEKRLSSHEEQDRRGAGGLKPSEEGAGGDYPEGGETGKVPGRKGGPDRRGKPA